MYFYSFLSPLDKGMGLGAKLIIFRKNLANCLNYDSFDFYDFMIFAIYQPLGVRFEHQKNHKNQMNHSSD
jgi:hypothetical protein